MGVKLEILVDGSCESIEDVREEEEMKGIKLDEDASKLGEILEVIAETNGE